MANKRWPDVRMTGPGYETTGRERFDNSVEFIFDYSDITIKSAQVEKQLVELSQAFRDISKSSNKQMKIRTIGSMPLPIKMLPESATIEKDMSAFAQIVAADSKRTIKKYIGDRIDTGRMIGSVYGRTNKSAGKITARAGWLDEWYKYFGFQENGTVHVSPMRTILRTFLEVSPQIIKSMEYYLKNYSNKAGK
jgi:hypothetical protein